VNKVIRGGKGRGRTFIKKYRRSGNFSCRNYCLFFKFFSFFYFYFYFYFFPKLQKFSASSGRKLKIENLYLNSGAHIYSEKNICAISWGKYWIFLGKIFFWGKPWWDETYL